MHWRDNFVKELCIVGLSGTAEITPPPEEKHTKRKSTGRSTLPPASSPSKSRSTTAVLVGSVRATSRASTYRSIPRFYGGPQLASAPSVASSKNLPDIRDTQQLGLHGTSKEIHGQSEVNWSGSVSQYSSKAYTCKTQTDGRDTDLRTELNSLPTADTGGIVARRTQSRARSEPSSQMHRALEFRPNIVIKPLKPKLDSKDSPSPNEIERNDLALFSKVNQHFRLDDKEGTPRKIVTPRLFGSPRGTQPEAGFEQLLTMKSIYRSADATVPQEPAILSNKQTDDETFIERSNDRNDRKFVLDLRQLSKKHCEKHTDLEMIRAAEQANKISPPSNDSHRVPQQEITKENLVNNWLDTCPVDAPRSMMLVDEKTPVIVAARKQIILNVPNIGQETG